MIVAAAFALAAHWAALDVGKGVAFGYGKDAYLILHFPYGDCRTMIVHKSPHMTTFYSDVDKARRFVWRSRFCLKK